MVKRFTSEEFVERAKNAHGGRYDYSSVEYINDRTKVLIICKDHGEFWQDPGRHIRRKHGCPSCRGKNISLASIKTSSTKFVPSSIKIHGDRYDYSKVKYINAKTKVNIICRKHGEFLQTPNVHLDGKGCRLCGYDRVPDHHFDDKEDFINKAKIIHEDCYDYSKVDYINSKTKVTITCRFGHEFTQSPGDHLSGRGCPHCYRKNEWRVGVLLKKYFKDWSIRSQKKVWSSFGDYLKPRFCDFWLEKDNIEVMVEYDGEQHFRPVQFYSISKDRAKEIFEKRKAVDILDTKYCKKNNIILHRVRYNEDKEKSIIELRNEIKRITK